MRTRSLCLLALSMVLPACGAPSDEELVGEAREAMTVCPGATTLEGVDVSHYDGDIDWAQVKGAGRAFAFVKATESTAFVDPKFAQNWAAMKQNGVVRSAYHFFHADVDPIAQADHFLATMGPLAPGDLPPTLDLETTNGQSGATITSNTIKWLDYVAMKTGTKPILYTSPGFVNGMGNPAGLDQHASLWVANWQVNCPDVPTPFSAWPFWQYSDSGSVAGISSTVDLDRFNGTMTDLVSMTIQGGSSSSSGSSSSGSSSSSSSSSGSSSSSSSGVTSSSSGAGGASSATTGAGGDATPDGPDPTGAVSSSSGNLIVGNGLQGGSGAPRHAGCACSSPGTHEPKGGAAAALALAGAIAARRARRRRTR